MILILSTPQDEHAHIVSTELLRLGVKSQMLDLSEFPQRLGLTMQYYDGKRQFQFGCDPSALDLNDCRVVWWRRPQPPQISPNVARASHRFFALNESVEALYGLWYALEAFWVNDPARDHVAQRKAHQLRVAQDVGLEVPATLISNCPLTVREFVATKGMGQVVYKSFSATEQEWRETRILSDDDLGLIENVQYAPVIFQEYIEAEVDLRVTVVGDDIFAAAIHSQETSYKVDFRIDMVNARIEATQLPTEVEDRLRHLMQRLGLQYGAIDMRRTSDGRHVFLEVNPAGQWLFVEHHTGQPIATCLAQLLHEKDRRQ